MELAQLLKDKKTEIIVAVCQELGVFSFDNAVIFDRCPEFVDTELSAFIDYLLTNNLEIPRSRARADALFGMGKKFVNYLFLSLLEYIGGIEGNYFVTLAYFVKIYLTEYIEIYDQVMYKNIHHKQGQLDTARDIIIQKQEAKLAAIRLREILKRYKITNTEYKVIILVMQGKENKEIADLLHCSEKTVKNHLGNIYKKLNVGNRIELYNFIKDI